MGGKARHHGFVGKDEISQQKGEGVDPKAVDDDIGRVQHLRRGPKGQTQRHQGKGPQPPAEPVETACFKPAQQRQRHGKDPKHLGKPQNTAAGHRHDEPKHRGRQRRQGVEGPGQSHVEVTQYPLKDQQPQRRGNQQFFGAAGGKGFWAAPFQLQPGADAGYHKQQHHEPGVEKILHCVLRLCRGEGPHHPGGDDAIVHVDNVIENHQQNGGPAEIVQIMPAHAFPAFAKDFNTFYHGPKAASTNQM